VLHLTTARTALGFSFAFASAHRPLVDYVEWAYRDLPAAAPGPLTTFTGEAATAPSDASDADGERRWNLLVEHPDGSTESCGAGHHGVSLVELLCWEVNRRARAEVAERTVLHAAAFAGTAGAVVCAGATRSGKSTLAAAAARRGWRHLSDDLVVVDLPAAQQAHAAQAPQAVPYARAMMLREGGRRLLGIDTSLPPAAEEFAGGDAFCPASALGAQQVHQPQPLVALVFLEWGDMAALAPLGRAATLHRLTQHSATLANRGADGFADLAGLAAQAPGYTLALGTPDAALDLLAPLIGA
jgi:hypothetical protein